MEAARFFPGFEVRIIGKKRIDKVVGINMSGNVTVDFGDKGEVSVPASILEILPKEPEKQVREVA